jgi:hypothetical protein
VSRRYLAAEGTPTRLGPHGRACDRCGWSRVCARVRWPTDVGAGWAIAAVWITTVLFLATAAGSIEQRLDGEPAGKARQSPCLSVRAFEHPVRTAWWDLIATGFRGVEGSKNERFFDALTGNDALSRHRSRIETKSSDPSRLVGRDCNIG